MIQRCSYELADINKVIIQPIPDFGDNQKRLNYINTQFPHFDYVITGNQRVRQIFKQTDKIVIPIEIKKIVKSSMLRNQLAIGQYSELEKSLPQ